MEALLPLHNEIRERAEAYTWMMEHREFIPIGADEIDAAFNLLSVQHEIADLLTAEITGYIPGRGAALAAAARTVVNTVLATEELALGCRWYQRDGLYRSTATE